MTYAELYETLGRALENNPELLQKEVEFEEGKDDNGNDIVLLEAEIEDAAEQEESFELPADLGQIGEREKLENFVVDTFGKEELEYA